MDVLRQARRIRAFVVVSGLIRQQRMKPERPQEALVRHIREAQGLHPRRRKFRSVENRRGLSRRCNRHRSVPILPRDSTMIAEHDKQNAGGAILICARDLPGGGIFDSATSTCVQHW